MELERYNAPLYVVGESEVKVFPKALTQAPLTQEFQLRVYLPRPFHPSYAFHTLYSSTRKLRERDGRGGTSMLYTGPRARESELLPVILPHRELPPNTPVYFQLYLYRNNEDHQSCQYLAATGECTINEWMRGQAARPALDTPLTASVAPPVRTGLFNRVIHPRVPPNATPAPAPRSGFWLELRNEDAERVATLSLSPLQLEAPCHLSRERLGSPPEQKTSLEPDFEDLNGYAPLNRQVARFMRVHVPSPWGFRIPFWMYAAGPIEPVTDRTDEAYWCNAAHLALQCLQIPAHEFQSQPWLFPEVLAQVVGQFTWNNPYLPDEKVDLQNQRRTGYEQFSYARSLPDEAHAAGDCEDGARDTALCFRGLRVHPITPESPPVLRALVFLTRFYACCTVDAIISLPSKGGYQDILHMYVKLVPWDLFYSHYQRAQDLPEPVRVDDWKSALDRFTAPPGTEDTLPLFTAVGMTDSLPVLQIESTDRSLGNWSNDGYSKRVEGVIKELKSVLDSGPLLADLAGRLTFYNTRTLFQGEAKFYLFDLSLSGFDIYRVLKQGAVLLSQKPRTYGCEPFAGFVLPSQGFALIPYLPVTSKDEKLLEWIHTQLPCVRPLQLHAEEICSEQFPPGKWIPLFVREERGKKHIDAVARISDALLQTPGVRLVHHTNVPITARVSTEILLVEKK